MRRLAVTLIFLLCGRGARAGGHAIVHTGDTVENLAAGLGDPGSSAAIRATNGLGPGAQPAVGQVLLLPDSLGGASTGALVLSSFGEGQARRPGEPAVPLSPGLPLPEGSVVCTDARSFATVRLALDAAGHLHDDVNLLPLTCMTVEIASSRPGARDSLVSLTKGSVTVQDGRTQGRGVVTVRTRDGLTSGERGGFRVHVEDSATRAEALYSPISLFGGGVERSLSAGQGSRVRAGRRPEDPTPLLVPGALISPEDLERLRVPEFRWTAVDRALGYRVEIAASPYFDDVVLVEESASALWQPEYLMLPFRVPGLWWRVASIDRTGFIGVPGDARQLDFPPGVGP